MAGPGVRTPLPRPSRWPGIAVFALILSACGGGGGGGNPPPAPPPPSPPPPAGDVTISGRLTYDFVPHSAIGGLDYAGTVVRPMREVTVQFVEAPATARVTGATDTDGNYSLTVPANLTGFIRVRAQSFRNGTPGWSFRVVDNVNRDVIYVLDGAPLSSGSVDSTRDLHAASGWTGTAYGNERAAAPFAILDTAYEVGQFVLANGTSELPVLNLHWSPDNVPELDETGQRNTLSGQIGSSFFRRNATLDTYGIYLLGAEDIDAEEYDRHVIAHEFGHYVQFARGRSDSIGGPHARGDRLDPRTAFSEGWATAFAALALGDTVYIDSLGPMQSFGYQFDVETAQFPNPARGWFSEESIWELLYDLVDPAPDGNDVSNYEFAELLSVMTARMESTTAAISIFPLLHALKTAYPGDAAAIDALASTQTIGVITSDYGDGALGAFGDPDVLPVHTELIVDGPAASVCSTDRFTSNLTGAVNKLASRRFLRFTPPVEGNVEITVRTTSTPDGVAADPDWILHRFGTLTGSIGAPSEACRDTAAPDWEPGLCVEQSAFGPLVNAEYLLEVYEWTNTNDTDDPFPPIGRTCFDVTVEQV